MTRTRKFTVILTAIAAIVLIVAAILNATVISPWLEEKRAQKEHARRVEEYRAAKREIFAEENAERQDYDIAFIGDSITDLYNVKEFFPDLAVTNRGIGGDTTYDLEGRLEISLTAGGIYIFPRYSRIISDFKEAAILFVLGVGLERQGDDCTYGVLLCRLDRVALCALALPQMRLITAVSTRQHAHLVAHHKARIKSYTKLTDDIHCLSVMAGFA